MKQFKFKSIRTRLVYWFLFLTLIPLLIVLSITYFQQVSVIKSRTFDKLTAIRDLKVDQLTDWLNERVGDLMTISTDNEFRDLESLINKTSYDQNDNEIMKNCRRILNRYLENYSAYDEVFIINPQSGKILLSTKTYMEGINKSTDDYFTKPMQSREMSIKDIYYSSSLKTNTMVYSIPIFCKIHAENHIVGILVARIDLPNTLYKMLLNRVGLGNTGETLIVNKDAVALNELRHQKNAPLNLIISTEPAVKAANGETGIAITTDYRDIKILSAFTYIPETRWGFVCKQDMHELNSPIRQMILNFIIIFIVTSLIIVLIVLRISKSLSGPVVDIVRVAQKYGTGDFSVRNTITSTDETGFLALEFNKMADAIESKLKIQNGVTDISDSLLVTTSMLEFGSKLLKQLMKLTDANMSTFYILNEATMEYEHFTSVGANEKLLTSFSAESSEGEIGNAISTKDIYYLRDIPENTIFKYKTTAGEAIPREIITIPLLVENNVAAIVSLVSIHKFSIECIEILKQSWGGINISYSNLLANERTRIFSEQLANSNQELEAQAEELEEQSEEMQEQTEELQEQNLILENQRLLVEEANKLKSEFLSNMSHELRTPLNSILALSNVLIKRTKSKLNDEENNYLEIVERNGKQLLSLINDILDLSKIEAGKMEIQPNNTSVDSVLRIVKENLQTLSEQKGLNMTLTIPDNLPRVETDESLLHQVLTNIVGNALKFTKKGNVDITATYDLLDVFIEVKDTGIGISKEILPHIFDEFRQGDGSSSRQYEGTGLGLAISNKITQILGGNIKVISKEGKGSVFTINIPIIWHKGKLADNLFDTDNITSRSELRTNLDMDKYHKRIKDISETSILIVEDNNDVIVQLNAVLENEEYKISVADNGQKALDYLEHTIPDGIILDLMMPDMDGFEFLQKIGNVEKTKNIPVLVLTAKKITKTDLKRLTSNNIQHLIIKGDVDLDDLLMKIKLMLGIAPVAESKVVEQHKSSSDVNKSNKGKEALDATLPNVLIVEDNLDNMTTMKAILRGKYNIAGAVDGEQGLKMAQSQLHDLILLDMALPKMSGEEIVKILKADNETKHIYVIAVTAQAMKGEKETMLTIGCDDYVSKPVDPEIILKKLEEWFGK